MFSAGLDYTITACVAFLLLGKYIFFDSAMDKEMNEFVVEFKDLKERERKASESEQQNNSTDDKSGYTSNGDISQSSKTKSVHSSMTEPLMNGTYAADSKPIQNGGNIHQSNLIMTSSSPSVQQIDNSDDVDSSMTKYLCKKEQYDGREGQSKDSLGYSSRSRLFTIGESTECLDDMDKQVCILVVHKITFTQRLNIM